ncbi:MAG: 50S ribosomal protein L24 [Brevinematales bacterium]|nr:50S ribosomal protein L24 [Brevinematales bacterium]
MPKKTVKTKLKKGDVVVVIAGKDKGKVGEIIDFDGDRVYVRGVNIIKKTQRKTKDNPKGGIIATEGSIHISNVMIYNKKLGKGDRIGIKYVNGKKVRVFKKTGDYVDKV